MYIVVVYTALLNGVNVDIKTYFVAKASMWNEIYTE